MIIKEEIEQGTFNLYFMGDLVYKGDIGDKRCSDTIVKFARENYAFLEAISNYIKEFAIDGVNWNDFKDVAYTFYEIISYDYLDNIGNLESYGDSTFDLEWFIE